MLAPENQVAAGQVGLGLQLVTSIAQQSFLVVELEGCLVPWNDLVADLVCFGQPRPRLALAQVHERDSFAVEQDAEDASHRTRLAGRDVGGQLGDVDDLGNLGRLGQRRCCRSGSRPFLRSSMYSRT